MFPQYSSFLIRKITLFMLIPIIFSACGNTGPEEDQITVNDTKEVQGTTSSEIFRVDNKNSSSTLTVEQTAKKQYTYDVEVSPKPGVRMNNEQVRQEILKLYNIPEGKKTDEQLCMIPVEVPAGKVYLYEIEWRDVWREGTIEVGEPDGNIEGTYRFKQGLICQVIGVSQGQ